MIPSEKNKGKKKCLLFLCSILNLRRLWTPPWRLFGIETSVPLMPLYQYSLNTVISIRFFRDQIYHIIVLNACCTEGMLHQRVPLISHSYNRTWLNIFWCLRFNKIPDLFLKPKYYNFTYYSICFFIADRFFQVCCDKYEAKFCSRIERQNMDQFYEFKSQRKILVVF